MYGVVLWSDNADHKAVIWCEDHGDLAFYSGRSESAFEGISLDAGDLVHFTLTEGRDVRVASRPRLVAEQQYPGLAERLKAGKADAPAPAQHRKSDNVIAFRQRRHAAPLYA